MRPPFTGEDAILEILSTLDSWVTQPLTVYPIGGTAMTASGFRDQTDDIDLVLSIESDFDHLATTLRDHGFNERDTTAQEFPTAHDSLHLTSPDHEYKVDIFETQIVGRARLTDEIKSRATGLWSGTNITAELPANEDIFLFKAIAAGDYTRNRTTDLDDLRALLQTGLNHEDVIDEIHNQLPFNTGALEADHIENNRHPIQNIQRAFRTISGLPPSLTDPVDDLARDIELEYYVLQAIRQESSAEDIISRDMQTNTPDDLDGEIQHARDRLHEKAIIDKSTNTLRIN